MVVQSSILKIYDQKNEGHWIAENHVQRVWLELKLSVSKIEVLLTKDSKVFLKKCMRAYRERRNRWYSEDVFVLVGMCCFVGILFHGSCIKKAYQAKIVHIEAHLKPPFKTTLVNLSRTTFPRTPHKRNRFFQALKELFLTKASSNWRSTLLWAYQKKELETTLNYPRNRLKTTSKPPTEEPA